MHSPDNYYDEIIDLRELVLVLWNQKRFILSLMLFSLLAAFIANQIMNPTFESSMVISLPGMKSMSESISATPELFKELAISNAVLTKITQNSFSSDSVHALRRRIQVHLSKESPTLLTVTASGPTPESAYNLLIAWHDAFEKTTDEYFGGQLRQDLDAAEAIVEDRLLSYSHASTLLADFDRTYSISFVEQTLTALQSELTQAMTSLRNLSTHVIPSLEQQVAYWNEVLASEDLYLEGNGLMLTLDTDGASTPRYFVVNPIHIQASQALVSAREQLLLAHRQHDALAVQIASLEQAVQAQRDLLVSLREERELLTRELARLTDLYNTAVAKRDAIKESLDRLETTIAQLVVSPPLMSEFPVKPRKLLNMVIALFLGGFVGVGVAFIRSWWYAPVAMERPTCAQHRAADSDFVVLSQH